jgi:hypothetical protein
MLKKFSFSSDQVINENVKPININQNSKTTFITTFIRQPDINAFISHYKSNKLPVIHNTEEIKGFYLNSKIIDMFTNNPNADGLYLYFAKKTPPIFDDEYTLIAIASKTVGSRNELIINSALEWHDPVTKSNMKPTNEDEIGYSLYE